jgi:hypothetical protein
VSWSTTNSYDSGTGLSESWALLDTAVAPGFNVTTYYWIDVPPVQADQYSGNLTIQAVEAGDTP